jgi:hypothetical protein
VADLLLESARRASGSRTYTAHTPVDHRAGLKSALRGFQTRCRAVWCLLQVLPLRSICQTRRSLGIWSLIAGLLDSTFTPTLMLPSPDALWLAVQRWRLDLQ